MFWLKTRKSCARVGPSLRTVNFPSCSSGLITGKSCGTTSSSSISPALNFSTSDFWSCTTDTRTVSR